MPGKSLSFNFAINAQLGSGFNASFGNASNQISKLSKTYKEFVDKFKPKKTTDDCYTPDAIYKAVKDWAIKEMDWGRTVVRPFWPGGDYENFDYPTGCVVIDNPQFSILSKIVKFYEDHRAARKAQKERAHCWVLSIRELAMIKAAEEAEKQ